MLQIISVTKQIRKELHVFYTLRLTIIISFDFMQFVKVITCFIQERKTSTGLNAHSVDAPGKKTFDVK